MSNKTLPIREKLLESLRALAVIDAHEHLMPECEQIASPKDALMIYGQYTRLPMFASGLSQEDWNRMHDPALPLERRWALAKPYISKIKYTSFAWAARLALQGLWGIDELTDENIAPLSERIMTENKSGIYERVLKGCCNIVHVLNQNSPPPKDRRELEVYRNQNILLPVVSLIDTRPPENTEVNRIGGSDGFGSLDDYLEWARQRVWDLAKGGAVGFKTFSLAFPGPDRPRAVEQFYDLKRGGRYLAYEIPGPLLSYIHDELLKTVVSLGVTVAVHTGFWGVNRYHPIHMMSVIERHPEVHFDLFHAGIPYVRELGLIAVNFPNTSVNLCWAHSIDASMTASALEEYIDQLGTDKIIAFGGDVRWMVEKVYGHLELARHNIADVLARRIERGLMDLEDATRIAKLWFYDNPARIYRLPVPLD